MLEEGDLVGIVGARQEINNFFKLYGVGTKKVPDAMIVGGGKIGYFLAKNLIASGIKVKIVEFDRDRCEFLSEVLPQADVINGDGTDRNLLMEEGLGNASGFAALTSIDEENILLSLFALDHVKSKTVTKINRINYDEVIDRLNLDTIINPNKVTNDMLIQFIRSMEYTKDSNIENYRKIGDDEAEAMEFIVDEQTANCGKPLKELATRPDVLLACITHAGMHKSLESPVPDTLGARPDIARPLVQRYGNGLETVPVDRHLQFPRIGVAVL